MKTLINPTPLNPKHLISSPFTSIKTFKQSPLPSSRPLIVKCSFEERNNGGLKDMVSGLVDKRVEELLNKEENRGLLDGLEKASLRVEMAKKELAEIERRELEASVMKTYVDEMETRASEIAECQKEILEARAMVEEAERSLSGLDENVGKDEERLESVKAAAISAVIGSLAGLPIALSQATSSTQLILPLAITFASCALFGVTFRYTIRRDLDDIHLKSGIVAAFGIVKGHWILLGYLISRSIPHLVYTVFWAGCFGFPKIVLNKMEITFREFLWAEVEHKRAIASVAWEDICVPKDEGGLGDGQKTLFWKDPWSKGKVLEKRCGVVTMILSGISRTATNEVILNGVGNIPTSRVRSADMGNILQYIYALHKPCIEEKDQVIWTLTNEGTFTTKSAWKALRNTKTKVNWHKFSWDKDAVLNHSFIAWQFKPEERNIQKFKQEETFAEVIYKRIFFEGQSHGSNGNNHGISKLYLMWMVCLSDARKAYGGLLRLPNGILIAAFNRKCNQDVDIGALVIKGVCEGLCIAEKLGFMSGCTVTDSSYAEKVALKSWLAALGAGPPLELNSASFLSHAVNGAVYVSEDLLVFVFASVGLDYCFKMQLLSPFPTKKSMSETS
ncbi:hypothetical protein GIB67_000924 [Kingdonia uniflora]|uniref:RNase H type-1 domain-containing protein n=1 Tax=Kingdonia uniflora TaxID=39325 RepID=A0A7J7MFN8_9MAGN|nr:hypothetical protein GIB67_000924 [Kingdonia uniflora]